MLAITKLHDTEEDIWSPTYGLRGKLDATVQTIISKPLEPTPFVRGHPKAPRTFTSAPLPFEIKTGRANHVMEHRAQTMLYTLLASERYGVDVQEGLLYYTQSQEVMRVPKARNEVRGLLIGRNEIAGWLMKRVKVNRDEKEAEIDFSKGDEPFLPGTIDDDRICKRCYALDACMLFRKVCPLPLLVLYFNLTNYCRRWTMWSTSHLSPTHMS